MYGISVGIDCPAHGQWDAEQIKRGIIKGKQVANTLHPADTLKHHCTITAINQLYL